MGTALLGIVFEACVKVVAAMLQCAAGLPDWVIRSPPRVAAHMAVHVDTNLQQTNQSRFSRGGRFAAFQHSPTPQASALASARKFAPLASTTPNPLKPSARWSEGRRTSKVLFALHLASLPSSEAMS